MTLYQQTPRRQLQVSEDLMGSGGELLAVPGTKKQGDSVVLASPRKVFPQFLSSKTCCSAYFGVPYDNMSVAKLQLILLCLGFLLSKPKLAVLFIYHLYCSNTCREDRRNSENATLNYKLLIKVFSQKDEGEKGDTLDLVCEQPFTWLWEGARLCTIAGYISQLHAHHLEG